MEAILLKIEELGKELFLNNNSLNTSSNITSISYGYKHVNNIQTDELCVVYTVKEKKPISELLPSEIISKTISIDNAIVKTDVKELYSIELLACNPACGQVAGPSSAANRAYTRPLKGGLSITSTNTVTTVGTMGFIAVHTATNTLVGVTNNHVVIQDAYIACNRGNSSPFENEYQPINSVYQNGEAGVIPPPNYTIGQTLKYKPIYTTATNSVDCAIFSLRQPDIDMAALSTSVMQSGEAYTAALPFATTAEINSLLASNPMLYSSGRTTGPKGGVACPLRILSTFNTFSISYPLQGIPTPCTFTNVLSFVKPEFDPSLSTVCVNPIFGGDSGSALIADFGGVRKIIGLVFASGGDAFGNTFFGYACRIDVVATQMGIQAWDGTNKGFVDESSIVYKTVPGLSCNETLQCSPSDPIHYQVGVTNTLSNPCPSPLINNFTTTWQTTTASESIELPYIPTAYGGTYTGTINWGDGNITPNSFANRIHTYLTPGTYTVTVIGTCIGWNFDAQPASAAKIKSVVHWGQLQNFPTSFGFSRMFSNCINLDLSSVSDTLDLTGVGTLNYMFLNCSSLTSVNNINSWNIIGITDINGMFWGATSFNQALSFNTSAVTDMSYMFQFCSAFNSALTFNTSSVTNMSAMFGGCSVFNQPVSFNTGAVTNMYGMFYNCTAFNQPLIFNTSIVTNMASMFSSASAFNQPLTFNTAAVTNMEGMFESATAFNSTLTFSSLASVTTMYNMFRDAASFNQPLTWDMPLNTRMGFMFKGCTVFNSPLTFTSTSNVFDINRMFLDCPVFNQPITFDTSGVIWPMYMFQNAIAFNQPLIQGVNGWDTSSFKGLRDMFNGAIAFNQNISSWDVSGIQPTSVNPLYGCEGFMTGKTPATWSQTNFDNLLCAWSSQILNANITIDFGTAQFTNATGLACKNVLTSAPNNWTVNSGGGV